MQLNRHDFYILFNAATAEQDRERYIAEWSTSSIFYPKPESPDIDANELVDSLGNIWDVSHMTTCDIRQHLGLTQAAFAEQFCIPRRTVEGWEARRTTPPYVVLLLAESAGMLKVVRDEGGNTK